MVSLWFYKQKKRKRVDYLDLALARLSIGDDDGRRRAPPERDTEMPRESINEDSPGHTGASSIGG
jgi:hypothetical protein